MIVICCKKDITSHEKQYIITLLSDRNAKMQIAKEHGDHRKI